MRACSDDSLPRLPRLCGGRRGGGGLGGTQEDGRAGGVELAEGGQRLIVPSPLLSSEAALL